MLPDSEIRFWLNAMGGKWSFVLRSDHQRMCLKQPVEDWGAR